MSAMFTQTNFSAYERHQVEPFSARRVLAPFLLLLAMVLSLVPKDCSAASINLNLQVKTEDRQIVVGLQNTGNEEAPGIYLETEAKGFIGGQCFQLPLRPGKKAEVRIPIPSYKVPGSYPIVARATYLNEGRRLGVVHVEALNVDKESFLNLECSLPTVVFRDLTEVSVPFRNAPPGTKLNLIVLPHLQTLTRSRDEGYASFYLLNDATQFRSQGSVFASFESEANGVHSLQLCRSEVIVVQNMQQSSWYSSGLILTLACLAILFSLRVYLKTSSPSLLQVVSARWSFSIFLCSTFYLGFRHLGWFADQVSASIRWWDQRHLLHPEVSRILRILTERLYFLGGDYEPFFRNLSDPLYTYMIFGNFFALLWLIRPDPASDKYWALMSRFYSCYVFRPFVRLLRPSDGRRRDEMGYDKRLSNVALLALCVKVFYLPMIWSWTGTNVNHMQEVLKIRNWDYFLVMKTLVDVMIFIDVGIFTFGYAIEIPRLKNVIKSVEPTLFGWAVCLICYPPFNQAFFPLFDRQVVSSWPVFGEATRGAVTAVTVFLWFIYCWASVALGFKSSNLTNRGIIDKGPYKYVRHPAYAGKVSVWVLSSLFLGEGYGLNIFTAVCIYTLRAITEERHLKLDPDYLEYRKRVRWMFIPGII